jgi:hypothetical protein
MTYSKAIINAFSSAFEPAFGGAPAARNTAHGGLALRHPIRASARIRQPRDIAGTLKKEITESQTTLSRLASILSHQQRNVATTLQSQLASAQTTLSQLLSILP